MRTMIITGTGTDVGKTVVTAAVAALAAAAGDRVVVVKPAQTGIAPGEPGDLADVERLTGHRVRTLELARYPEPLAPATAARRSGLPPLHVADVEKALAGIDDADLVLVEGAGGLLVRLNDDGETLADLDLPVLLVATAGLGVLNTAALTAEALASRRRDLLGTVVGAYPEHPDLAERTNLADLPRVTGRPLLGVLPADLGRSAPDDLEAAARCGLHPVLGGQWIEPSDVRQTPDGSTPDA
ncbi:dethiobiotin synthase [Actinomycetospora termitidis]|uniref:ATP-dependent dethiobiotin synthetase BioD n=1 Tax=Actinomycetospora termitidis TaxID=3053470 RepID=A0ABT7M8C6_9PSEU|nr:dethiobiotin synthase [Actinomycetospora sp. Odt1-22]MDL5156920.1 dethiobiotin synthase [Actinomycetospora sp. Odt1-22]